MKAGVQSAQLNIDPRLVHSSYFFFCWFSTIFYHETQFDNQEVLFRNNLHRGGVYCYACAPTFSTGINSFLVALIF